MHWLNQWLKEMRYRVAVYGQSMQESIYSNGCGSMLIQSKSALDELRRLERERTRNR